MDAAYWLSHYGSEVVVLDESAPWASGPLSDSSNGLSPVTFDKLQAMRKGGKVQFVSERASSITATEVVTKSRRIELEHPAFDATGFDMRQAPPSLWCPRGPPREQRSLHGSSSSLPSGCTAS